jgi:fructokinase
VRIGVDLGGTKIEAIAIADSGEERFRHRVSTPRDYRGSITAIRDLVARLEGATGSGGTVGVGIPGALSPESGLVKNANSTWLIGHPLQDALEAALDRPVRIMNDANCFTLSEATDGAAAGSHVVFGVILGTGVGGGITVAGRCLEGPNRIAGEWGHNPLPPGPENPVPGPACYCGRTGCIETYLSGPGLIARHQEDTGRTLTTHALVSAEGAGDAAARRSLDRYRDRLARSLATVINVVDPDVIVLGGGMSNVPELAEAVGARLGTYVFSDQVRTRVACNFHGDSSGVRGAAWLWPAD